MMDQFAIEAFRYLLAHGNAAAYAAILVILGWQPVWRRLLGYNGRTTLHGRLDGIEDSLTERFSQVRKDIHGLRVTVHAASIDRARDDERIKAVEKHIDEMQEFCRNMHTEKKG